MFQLRVETIHSSNIINILLIQINIPIILIKRHFSWDWFDFNNIFLWARAKNAQTDWLNKCVRKKQTKFSNNFCIRQCRIRTSKSYWKIKFFSIPRIASLSRFAPLCPVQTPFVGQDMSRADSRPCLLCSAPGSPMRAVVAIDSGISVSTLIRISLTHARTCGATRAAIPSTLLRPLVCACIPPGKWLLTLQISFRNVTRTFLHRSDHLC